MKKAKLVVGVVVLVIALCAVFAWAVPSAVPFNATGSMGVGRSEFTATVLPDGTVLVAGGSGTSSSAEVYDPALGTFATTTGSMSSPRVFHSAVTVTASGGVSKVLITGGDGGAGPVNTAELYTPTTGTFSQITSTLTSSRDYHSSTLLPNGSVLIAGGEDGTTLLNTAEIYDPSGDTFTASTSTMTSVRDNHTATLLPNGTVLIAGGFNGYSITDSLNTAEIYDPNGDTFTATTGTMASARAWHTATLLQSGKVLITGGIDASGTLLNTAEIYDQTLGTFTSTAGPMISALTGHTATLLTDGTVLIAGGYDDFTQVNTAEIYDPVTNRFWATAAPMNGNRAGQQAALLPGGTVLIVGGYDGTVNVATAEIFDAAKNLYQTTTTLTAPLTSKVGQSINFIATVSRGSYTAFPATGNVIFSDGTNSNTVALGVGGTATYNTSNLAIGSYGMTAFYSGDSRFDLSTSNTVTQAVSINTTTVGLATTRATAKVGQAVTFTATVSRGTATAFDVTGDVTFYTAGTTTLGTGVVSSGPPYLATYSTSSLPIGSNAITATYNGDANYSGNTSAGLTQTVIITATSTTVSSGLNPATTVDPVTFTATVSQLSSTVTGTCSHPIGGIATFKKNGTVLGTGAVTGDTATGTATFLMSALTITTSGNYSITAEYSGDANYDQSASGTLTQVVHKALATISLSNLEQIYSASTKTVTATTDPPGLPVDFTFSSATSSVPLSAGTYTVTAAISSSSTRTGKTTGTLVIAKKPLSISGLISNTKPYDGTTAAVIGSTAGTLVGLAGSPLDVVTYTAAGTFDTALAGVGKIVTLSTVTLAGTPASNYSLTLPGAVTSAVTGTITKKALAVTGMVASNKAYDGTTVATLSAGTGTLVGVVSGETVTFSPGLAFVSKTTGTSKVVTVMTLTLNGPSAGSYIVSPWPTVPNAIITKATLTVAAIGKDKVYDGKLTSTPTLTDNRYKGDSLTVTYTLASFDTPSVGSGKTVTVTGIKMTGTAAGNYTVGNLTATTTAAVTTKPLIIAGMKADTKEYNGTNAATFTGTNKGKLSGVITGNSVTFSVGLSTFASVTAGVSKPVNLGAITLSGSSAANYSVTPPRVTGTITPKKLTVTGITAADKVYDRTTAAGILSGGTLSGKVGSDVVTIVTGTLTFKDKKVGTGKTVVISSVSLGGADKANYTVNLLTSTTTANITQRPLTVGVLTGYKKTYDGTVKSAPTYTDNRIKGDSLTVKGTATFDTPDVGTGKLVTIASITFSGTDAMNYSVSGSSVTSANADVIPKKLAIIGMKADAKVYDGTNTATFVNPKTRGTLSGIITGETGTLNVNFVTVGTSSFYSAGSTTFSRKSVGSNKLVSLATLTLTGAKAGNYTVAAPAKVYGTITAKPLAASDIVAVATDRPFAADDTHADVTVSLVAPIAGDDLVLAGVGTFADPNPGTLKPVTVKSVTKTGADAGNYSLATGLTVTTTASIY